MRIAGLDRGLTHWGMVSAALTTPSGRALAAACLLWALAAGCGGAQQTTPEHGGAAAAQPKPEPPPAVPDDALQILPAGIDGVARADLTTLRKSPHYPRIEGWARRYGCLGNDVDHWLLQRTELLVMTSYPPSGAGGAGASPSTQPGSDREFLALARGRFRPQDGPAALALAADWSGQPAAPAGEEQRIRGFAVWQSGPTAVAVLGERWLLAGSRARVEQTLAGLGITGFQAVTGDPWLAERGGPAELQKSDLVVHHLPDRESLAQLRRQLGAVGAGSVGRALVEAPIAVHGSVGDDVRAQAVGRTGSAEQAAAARKRLSTLLRQASFVLKLTGAPGFLDRARIEATPEAELRLGLDLQPGEVPSVARRLEAVLNASTRRCPEPDAQPAQLTSTQQ